MTFLETLIFAVIETSLIAIWLTVVIAFLYTRVYYPNRVVEPFESFEELMVIFGAIIQTELDEYDDEIFVAKGAITNQNFDMFYKDLSSKILDAMSNHVRVALSRYITDDEIITIVARRVKKYLTDKINGTI